MSISVRLGFTTSSFEQLVCVGCDEDGDYYIEARGIQSYMNLEEFERLMCNMQDLLTLTTTEEPPMSVDTFDLGFDAGYAQAKADLKEDSP